MSFDYFLNTVIFKENMVSYKRIEFCIEKFSVKFCVVDINTNFNIEQIHIKQIL